MHITMVKKKLLDGSDCRKCEEITTHLKTRGLWDRIDEVVWAIEGDPTSPGMVLGEKHGVERAPFFIVSDGGEDRVYTSVLMLARDCLTAGSTQEEARTVDPDDIGGI